MGGTNRTSWSISYFLKFGNKKSKIGERVGGSQVEERKGQKARVLGVIILGEELLTRAPAVANPAAAVWEAGVAEFRLPATEVVSPGSGGGKPGRRLPR